MLAATPQAAHTVTIDWVTVPGTGTPNACETQVQGCFGAVANTYLIGKYEVTNAQYAEFLNAVAATDMNGLYNTSMGSGLGGITRDCSSGPCTYSTILGRGNMPVNWVSFWDALRFANWLHNGQGSGDTETGAYTITADGITNNSITRNADATIFLTSEDEWYKAAYYDAASTSYFNYPTGSSTAPTAESPPGTDFTNGSANYNAAVGGVTDVGAYGAKPSDSPYGTFDQGGNVDEWTEAISGSSRVLRGGSFGDDSDRLSTAWQGVPFPGPSTEDDGLGFRVAMIPEPSTALLLSLGIAALALRRRLSA